ncbi:hypothetical protein BGZ76_005453 [Entomortierella beljakovae]|nr:hypothetical protein BGZ76_005453 [Entomortierella beljakovae]
MGVCGEKHTSLTREQKRQLIHQADTHKLRPTEVCDWVQATWGLRIARVTVYSILHKQRASLMAGHKDLYQTMQNSLNGTPVDSQASAGVIGTEEGVKTNKFRASPKSKKNKEAANVNTNTSDNNASCGPETVKTAIKRSRSSSVLSDRSTTPVDNTEAGARWEGQLKRVREPASVELDRAMVEFLKSPASVDSQGRRLNDAELQAHALRLAQSIPSASRMRCSFGWLRHFKRRLGVQWAADKLGKYRWTVEIDPQEDSNISSITHRDSSVSSDDDEYHSTNEFGSLSPSPNKRSKTTHSDTNEDAKPHIPSSHQDNYTSYSDIFNTLPTLHVPSSGSMGTISPLATTLDPKLTSSSFIPPNNGSMAYGMSVDGRMRKVPSKEEAYDMLQSLLMYYEQDHTYVGEQQTLLLPRWIHQQRQLMHQSPAIEAKLAWMRSQQQEQQQHMQLNSLYQPFVLPFQSIPADPQAFQRYSTTFASSASPSSSTLSLSPPALSPMSPMSPLSPESPTVSPFNLGLSGGSSTLNDPFVSVKADPSFAAAFASLDHSLLSDHSLLFSAQMQRHE